MKVVRVLFAPIGMVFPIVADAVTVTAEHAHAVALYTGIALAIVEMIATLRKCRCADHKEGVSKCLLFGGVGALIFMIGAITSLRFARDGGYVLFAISHMVKAFFEFKKNVS